MVSYMKAGTCQVQHSISTAQHSVCENFFVCVCLGFLFFFFSLIRPKPKLDLLSSQQANNWETRS